MEKHDIVEPRDCIPEDERVTLPDLSKVFDDDDDGPDPLDSDIIPSENDPLPPYAPEGEA